METSDSVSNSPEVSVIVPARNEEASLGACLESLVGQAEVASEIIVVDDHSSDRTQQIAQSFSSVRVVTPPDLPSGWTGKNNALVAGANHAHGSWLLFTDADTVHRPGSLRRSLDEAQREGAALLSYSPRQEVRGFWERAVMPVIFAELACRYRPAEVCDPKSDVAAANGQYLLISRQAYDAVGGHAAMATNLLEDVALARAVKRTGGKIYFRYGEDAVSTRMYRSFAQLREGWTKNLALLFSKPLPRAAARFCEFGVIAGGAALTLSAALQRELYLLLGAGMGTTFLYALFLTRVRRAHFLWFSNLLAIFGLPVFSYLLWRSQLTHKKGSVAWKGRVYRGSQSDDPSARAALLNARF